MIEHCPSFPRHPCSNGGVYPRQFVSHVKQRVVDPGVKLSLVQGNPTGYSVNCRW